MKTSPFVSSLAVFAAASFLAGCGLAETSAVAVSEANASAEQAKKGKELEEKVKNDIEAMQQQTADKVAAAEEGSE